MLSNRLALNGLLIRIRLYFINKREKVELFMARSTTSFMSPISTNNFEWIQDSKKIYLFSKTLLQDFIIFFNQTLGCGVEIDTNYLKELYIRIQGRDRYKLFKGIVH